jgi:hypothetical protein
MRTASGAAEAMLAFSELLNSVFSTLPEPIRHIIRRLGQRVESLLRKLQRYRPQRSQFFGWTLTEEAFVPVMSQAVVVVLSRRTIPTKKTLFFI